MSLRDYQASIGVAPAWHDWMWPAFEAMAVDLLVRAFEKMRATNRYQLTWKENRLSAELLIYIEELRHDNSLPVYAHDEARVLEELSDPDDAPRIDLAVRHTSMRRPVYFGVEAKVVTAVTVGWRTLSSSSAAYVTNGVHRYTTGAYGENVGVSSMLAFVLAEPLQSIIAAVNAALVTHGAQSTELLGDAQPLRTTVVYRSVHPRSGRADIRLHHIFCPLA